MKIWGYIEESEELQLTAWIDPDLRNADDQSLVLDQSDTSDANRVEIGKAWQAMASRDTSWDGTSEQDVEGQYPNYRASPASSLDPDFIL